MSHYYNNYKIYINNSSYITTPYIFSNKYNSLLTYKEKMFFLNLKGTNVFEDYFQYELHLSPRIVFKLYIPIDHNSNNGNLRLYIAYSGPYGLSERQLCPASRWRTAMWELV